MAHRFRRFIPALFIIGVATTAIGQLGDTPVHAANNQSQAITLSPASTEVTVDPGATATKSVDVINSGSDSFNVKVSTSPYYVSGEDYDPRFTQLPGTVDASGWVHLSLTSATIAGLKVLSVPYTVTVPKDTPAGGYYAVVFAETSTDDQKTGVVSHNRVGDILYITVNGNIKSGGNVIGSPLPSVSFVGSIPISTKVSNSGGTHFVTKTAYSVTDMTGKLIFTATTERYVLPQTERTITSSWTPQSLFGIFTVKRSATIDGVVKTLPDERIVIINPWVFVAVAFLLGILIGIPFRRARRRRRSKEK
ncbi:MAG TPA: hypothetical protein VIM31_00815 [Candidatus Microsaccharimonas sp.]|jgi:hypothetical protein